MGPSRFCGWNSVTVANDWSLRGDGLECLTVQKTSSGPMSRAEAWQVLGLEPGASPEQVSEAHRRLMTKLHPDHGGTDYLASKINTARDVLLKPS